MLSPILLMWINDPIKKRTFPLSHQHGGFCYCYFSILLTANINILEQTVDVVGNHALCVLLKNIWEVGSDGMVINVWLMNVVFIGQFH